MESQQLHVAPRAEVQPTSTIEVRPTDVGTTEVRPTEVRPTEVRSAEPEAHQPGEAQQVEVVSEPATAVAPAPRTRLRDERPALDVYEDAEAFYVVADVPGVEPASADVRIEWPHLHLACARPARDGEVVRYTSTLLLPTAVDPGSLTATLERGVLEIRMAKQPAARSRRIPVRAG